MQFEGKIYNCVCNKLDYFLSWYHKAFIFLSFFGSRYRFTWFMASFVPVVVGWYGFYL